MKNEEILEIRDKHFIASAVPYYQNPIQLVRASGLRQ